MAGWTGSVTEECREVRDVHICMLGTFATATQLMLTDPIQHRPELCYGDEHDCVGLAIFGSWLG